MQKEKILIVDDNPDVLISARYLLERHYETVITCEKPEDIPTLMKKENFDVILLDMNFHPGESDGKSGMLWLEKIKKMDPDAVIVMITAHGSLNAAVEAMKLGAADYVVKPWDNQRLLSTISAALKLRQSQNEASRLRQSNRVLSEVTSQHKQTIIGNSPVMKNLLSLVGRAAPTDANVLILGENGTGKELIAREIHRQSKRCDEVFIPVDLGSISETLFESELFGHKKGAFTDAKEDRIGYIRAANGGSLFLDEIGNIPLHLQVKLLSVLEKRELSQVGSRQSAPVNVRIIAATNMPKEELSDPKHFRQDLLFRLNTVEINLPPLRDRPGDIEDIVKYYLSFYCTKYTKPIKQIKPETMEQLVHYQWPGNVRALRHAVERAVILSREDYLGPEDFQLEEQHLIPAIHISTRPVLPQDSNKENAEMPEDSGASPENDLNLDRLEHKTILEALRRNRYVISNAAKDLGLTRAALYRRMEKYGI
ncbi:MAG: sigma-54-dependent Fis family transcriptional regulator [Deltaproteobacteria bacterium]|nr:sigma-54-dependent Fis family transcriptional regulator [Deltaproteobacteria bacterium]